MDSQGLPGPTRRPGPRGIPAAVGDCVETALKWWGFVPLGNNNGVVYLRHTDQKELPMKRFLTSLLCLATVLSISGCAKTNAPTDATTTGSSDAVVTNQTASGSTITVKSATPAKGIVVEVSTVGESHVVKVSSLPRSLEDLKAFDMTDQYQAAAAIMCTLANFEDNFDAALEMLDYIMGPDSPSAYSKGFIKTQIGRYPYVMRSYFKGATVENDYTPEEWTVTFTEDTASDKKDGDFKVLCQSAGADSPRGFTLRQKESTKEWFLLLTSYMGLMSEIRVPASADAWK